MSSPILALRDLEKIYPNGVHAVKGIDYSLKEGGCYAFLGPNGAGKSTTIGMICGLCIPTGGQMLFRGERVDSAPMEYRSSIGVVAQHPNLELDLTVYQNLKVHSMLYDIPKGTYQRRIGELLDLSNLQDKRNNRVRSLSGGMKRKVQIIRALLHQPSLLILDEPTVGLDPGSRQAIWDLLLSLRREGKTILFSTHYMEEAHRYADSISIIHQGKIITEGTAEMMIEHLGSWCRVEYLNDRKQVSFYRSREEAMVTAGSPVDELIIRKTTLEDVFIQLTGKELAS